MNVGLIVTLLHSSATVLAHIAFTHIHTNCGTAVPLRANVGCRLLHWR